MFIRSLLYGGIKKPPLKTAVLTIKYGLLDLVELFFKICDDILRILKADAEA